MDLSQPPRSRARTNGATQTFRRPSLATNLSNQREGAPTTNVTTPGTGVYVPPHLNSSYQSNLNRNGAATDSRYSKDQLLDLFRAQGRSGQANTNVSDLFVDGWSPGNVNGTNVSGWGRKDEHKEGSGGPEICWDHEGSVHPLALIELKDDEKEVWLFGFTPLHGIDCPSRHSSLPLIRHSNPQPRTQIRKAPRIMEM